MDQANADDWTMFGEPEPTNMSGTSEFYMPDMTPQLSYAAATPGYSSFQTIDDLDYYRHQDIPQYHQSSLGP